MAVEPRLLASAHGQRQERDVADVLEQILERHGGSAADLEEFIGRAAAWCEGLGTAEGRDLGERFRAISEQVALPNSSPHPDRDGLADSATPPAVEHAERARAALSSSRSRAVGAAPTSDSPLPPQTEPPGVRRIR
ncbi:hypothetical protein [Streptomyces carpaticus]|uniref:Uncharacterized protein n=1 Tax=Streptomyces carpaticus TaxID=285558 RepID=A0ABV4ZJ37_9ACTN